MWHLINPNLSNTFSNDKSFLLMSFFMHKFLFPSDFANVDCSILHYKL